MITPIELLCFVWADIVWFGSLQQGKTTEQKKKGDRRKFTWAVSRLSFVFVCRHTHILTIILYCVYKPSSRSLAVCVRFRYDFSDKIIICLCFYQSKCIVKIGDSVRVTVCCKFTAKQTIRYRTKYRFFFFFVQCLVFCCMYLSAGTTMIFAIMRALINKYIAFDFLRLFRLQHVFMTAVVAAPMANRSESMAIHTFKQIV